MHKQRHFVVTFNGHVDLRTANLNSADHQTNYCTTFVPERSMSSMRQGFLVSHLEGLGIFPLFFDGAAPQPGSVKAHAALLAMIGNLVHQQT